MTNDLKRKAGFYWVRFECAVIVAEYADGRACSMTQPHWHVPGSGNCWKDAEVCELLSGRLEIPGRRKA
jgi:hypothetical protein